MSEPCAIHDRDDVLRIYRQHVSIGLSRLAEFMAIPLEVRSAGNLVYDEHGQAYLDCGGYGVFFLGHAHPVVVERVKEQLTRHALSTRLLVNPELAAAAQRLADVAPAGLDYVFFTNSGAEAVEVALKIARLNGRRHIISMNGGFHGKTLGALSVTGRMSYQTPFMPLLPDVTFVPFGSIDALEQALMQHGAQSCVILEPVQAEGGVHSPPDGYLQAVRNACTKAGAFLILDEIQTGLGRLGAWWAADTDGVIPDILLSGKILSGGLVPVGAVITSASAYKQLNRDPILHSSTFSGNPLAMAAVQATIEVIQHERLVERAHTLGKAIMPAIARICLETCPSLVRDVRGKGLLIGVEFATEALAGDFLIALLAQRVLVSHSLNAHRVVRFTPSAILTDSECTWLLSAIREAATELANRHHR